MLIVENARQYLDAFIQLNEQWIVRYFELEDADKQIAANPYQIVEQGGYIFTLLDNDEIRGVCALCNDGEGRFELAKMAVVPEFRGRGYGDRLIEHCLEKLRAIQANSVYLVSNTSLTPAIALYKKHRFITISVGQHPLYKRGDIVMQRDLV
tara:strand:- start:159 stop:614 length:456 start_codon:yes stop_codon:yes gene_type:complete